MLYRSGEMLAKTLPTWARAAAGLPVTFVFADNYPADACASVIAENLPTAAYQYLAQPSNPGFAAGCNRAAAVTHASHILLLNPDVWLHDDSLARILAAVRGAPEVPIAVGLNMQTRDYAGIDINPISLFIDRAADRRRGPLGPSGGAAVLPRALFERFGGLYEEMFAWGEDADLAFRLYAAGVRTRVLNLSLPHAWGHSVAGDRTLSGLRAFLLARNRILVAARGFTWPLLSLTLPLMAVAHAALALRRAQQGLLRPFCKGVGQGVRGWPAARRGWHGKRFGLSSLASYLRMGRSDG